MKNRLLLCTLAGALLLPAITHADAPATKDKKATKSAPKIVAAKAAPADNHVIYYITDTPRTGSNIPMVYRRYNGYMDSASAAAVYGQTDLRRTGTTDVASELFLLDPSISINNRR